MESRVTEGKQSRLTAERARELFAYDPLTGVVVRRQRTKFGRKELGPVGSPDREGYLDVKADGTPYRLHRVIWLMVHGEWPKGVIDHINRIPDDNRIENLRDVDFCVNNQNRVMAANKTTGVMGVCIPSACPHKFKTSICVKGKNKFIGYFDSLEEARAAYLEAKRAFHAEGSPI